MPLACVNMHIKRHLKSTPAVIVKSEVRIGPAAVSVGTCNVTGVYRPQDSLTPPSVSVTDCGVWCELPTQDQIPPPGTNDSRGLSLSDVAVHRGHGCSARGFVIF